MAGWTGLLLIGFMFGGCGAGDSDQETEVSANTPGATVPDSIGGPITDEVAPSDTQTTDGPIPPSTPLTAEGWGPLRIGMTRAEVVAAAGEDANPEAVGGAEPEFCDEFRPERAPAGLLVMLESGRLTRISVGSSSPVRTDRGIGLGATTEEVRRTYGDRLQSTPHKYVAAPAAYLTIWTVEPPAADARGIVYEVGEDGRVSRIHAGGPSIQYVEGCL